MYYYTELTKIIQAIRKRKKERNYIRSRLDAYIEKTYGIPYFSQFIRTQFARSIIGAPQEIDEDKTYGVLARQIPGASVEDIAGYLLARRLGLMPCSPAFTRDVFHAGCCDKLLRANIPFVSWSKKQRLVTNNKWVLTDQKITAQADLNMVRMDKLQAGEVSLPEFHRRMQHGVFGAFPQPFVWSDVSPVYAQILAKVKSVGRPPTEVWRSNGDGKDVASSHYEEAEALDLTVRPSSKWYYPLFLSMFLDGTFVLMETYERDGYSLQSLFEQTMRDIQCATDYMPIVIQTCTPTPDLLFVNEHVVAEPARASEVLCGLQHWGEDTRSISRWFADQAIGFR